MRSILAASLLLLAAPWAFADGAPKARSPMVKMNIVGTSKTYADGSRMDANGVRSGHAVVRATSITGFTRSDPYTYSVTLADGRGLLIDRLTVSVPTGARASTKVEFRPGDGSEPHRASEIVPAANKVIEFWAKQNEGRAKYGLAPQKH